MLHSVYPDSWNSCTSALIVDSRNLPNGNWNKNAVDYIASNVGSCTKSERMVLQLECTLVQNAQGIKQNILIQ